MQVYHQDILIQKLNLYLSTTTRRLKLPLGYCHGISLYWLYMTYNKKEQAFYETVKKIIDCPPSQIDSISMDIEKFLSHIEWLQNPHKYTDDIHQMDVPTLTDMNRNLFISYIFSMENLQQNLGKIAQDNRMICLSGPNHTIGLFKEKGQYKLFDPNYSEGVAKTFTDLTKLQNEIINCLFFAKNTKSFPLEISVFSKDAHEDDKKVQHDIYQSISSEDSKLKKLNKNLYLAAQDGNADQVEFLFKEGADPHFSIQNSSPLLIAAQLGYANVVDIFLKGKANHSLGDKDKDSPLHLASSKGHDKTVLILLRHGANPMQINRRHATPLTEALNNNQWLTVIALLSYIKNIKSISSVNMKYLLIHRKEILAMVKLASFSLKADELTQLQKGLKQLYDVTIQNKPSPAFFANAKNDKWEDEKTYSVRAKL